MSEQIVRLIIGASPRVATGAIAGAGLRWICDEIAGGLTALVAVNALGCFVIGAVATSDSAGQRVRWLVATGFCGGLTTLSSFALEIAEALDASQTWRAGYSTAAVVVMSMLAYIGGRATARRWL